jgi:hypothetical protein
MFFDGDDGSYLIVETDPCPQQPSGDDWQPYAAGWWRVSSIGIEQHY